MIGKDLQQTLKMKMATQERCLQNNWVVVECEQMNCGHEVDGAGETEDGQANADAQHDDVAGFEKIRQMLLMMCRINNERPIGLQGG